MPLHRPVPPHDVTRPTCRPHNVTRRGLIKSTAAAGAMAATVGVLGACKGSDEGATPPTVVDTSSADYVIDPSTNESNYSVVDLPLTEETSHDIALGNVLHPAGGDVWIPMTTAGSSATPMVKASAFAPSSGSVVEVVPEPQAKGASNVVIYDVRCSDSAYAWVELDLLTHDWTLYAAPFSDGVLTGGVTTLWSASSDYDPPKFSVAGGKVIWEIMPSVSGPKAKEHSFCYLWSTGDANAKAVIESPGRFAGEPAVSGGTVTLVPRVNATSGVYYGITAYLLSDDLSTQVDQLVLPQSVRPLNAVRIGESFAFSIEANYSTGGLLGTMGTYIGRAGGPFVALSREPAASVTGRDGTYVIKSNASYFVVNSRDRTYSILGAVNRCLGYGEYPATQGESSRFVTYATVKDEDTGYPKHVTVRSFAL